MRKQLFKSFLALAALVLFFSLGAGAAEPGLKRVVIIKIDGLGGDYLDKWVRTRDPATGKSALPWIEEVFYRNGTRLENFYARGTSLSAPAWSMLDTGQHLQIRSNVEYDRYTGKYYDYLNFVAFYIDYGLKKRADMPAAEVLERLGIPLLFDAFPEEDRFVSPQLDQRGINWDQVGSSFANFLPLKPTEFINEWMIGFNFYEVPTAQSEEYLVRSLSERPNLDYLDYYSPHFDHVSHRNRDERSRFAALEEIDRLVGRIWKALEKSSRMNETGIFIVSDHGINADEDVYSQGFNLVELLTSASGGGHHVVTKRPVMAAYTLKSLMPYSLFDTADSKNSLYLRGESGKYPTVLLDIDGNERTAATFRNSDLNIIQILLQQLPSDSLSEEMKQAAARAVCRIVDRNRGGWEMTSSRLRDQLTALRRTTERQAREVAALKQLPELARGELPKDEIIRRSADLQASVAEVKDYENYILTLRRLLSLKPEDLLTRKLKIEEYVEPRLMGDPNSVYDLQHYVVGPSKEGLVLDRSGDIDLEKSFSRIDYSSLFVDQRVRNNVQDGLGNRPVDFVVYSIPAVSMPESLPEDLRTDDDVIWLNAGKNRQALIFSKIRIDGTLALRYLPVSGLTQNMKGGPVSFREEEWTEGFPLEMFEDPEFGLPKGKRGDWLNKWHSESEWLEMIHKTHYSNALISLHEYVMMHPLEPPPGSAEADRDEKIVRGFRVLQRQSVTPDFMILTKDHWNFNAIDLNPGGNHGSFFRISSNSVLMIAGGDETGIPRGLTVFEPYDSLSFVPTVLALMGRVDEKGIPDERLAAQGFRKFPGRIIKEVFPYK